MLVASLLAIVLLAISQLRMSSNAVLFAGGVVATLAEYVVHRFVLHGFAPTEHRLHHANPDDAVLTIFWQIWISFALIYLRHARPSGRCCPTIPTASRWAQGLPYRNQKDLDALITPLRLAGLPE